MDFAVAARLVPAAGVVVLAVYIVCLGRRKAETLKWALWVLRVLLLWALFGATALLLLLAPR